MICGHKHPTLVSRSCFRPESHEDDHSDGSFEWANRPQTYRDVLIRLLCMTDEQLDSHLTVELLVADECFQAELRIADANHGVLDQNHPIIQVKDF